MAMRVEVVATAQAAALRTAMVVVVVPASGASARYTTLPAMVAVAPAWIGHDSYTTVRGMAPSVPSSLHDYDSCMTILPP